MNWQRATLTELYTISSHDSAATIDEKWAAAKEMRKRMDPDGISFDKQGRMNYHPDFHTNHKKPFSLDDLIYMCKFYEYDGRRKIAFALGRTEHTILTKVYELRKRGDYYRYKNMSEDEWLAVAQ